MATIAEEVAALRGTKSATLKDLLTHPAFSRLLAAMTISSLGDWVGFVAVTSLVAAIATEANPRLAGLAVGGVIAARMLPAVLFGPIAGALVDRSDRKQVMIIADLGRGVMYGAMAFLGARLWAIFLLSFAIECLSLLWTPARDASLPNLVPRRQLANANSIGLISTYGTLPLGGAIFAVLTWFSNGVGAWFPYLGGHPESLALLLDAGTFGFSAFMVSRIDLSTRGSRRTPGGRFDLGRVWQDIRDGVRFLLEDSIASAMTGGIVIAFAAVGAVLALGPVFVASLDAQSAAWGVIVTAFGIGMVLGMVAANQVSKVFERDVAFVWGLVAAAVALFILAAMPNLGLAAVVAVWLGAFCGMAWVSGYTLLQENVVDEYRGRTFASLATLSRLGLFCSMLLFPILSSVYGNPKIYIGGKQFDLSGAQLALWTAGVLALGAGFNTRRLLKRYRLSRPQPLGLVPKLKRPPATGLFIAFEGVEGAGKGTQIRLAEEYLRSAGHDVLVTREPGGTELGERIRDVLLDPKTGKLDARSEALLFAAARAQTVTSVIRPALADGKIVICDRYVDSSLAYQGWARGLGEQDVLTLNVWATQGLFPDLVVLLHLEPERGLLRSTEAPDRMEMEGEDFHTKVADAYLKIAEEHPERFVVVEGDDSPANVFDGVKAALERVLHDREDDLREGD
jgi:dTMP kinase